MAEDDISGYGTVAGGLAGAALGVGLLSNPASIVSGLVGVAAPTSTSSGMMMTAFAPAAAAAVPVVATSALAVGIAILACVVVGAVIGHLITRHMHKKTHERMENESVMRNSVVLPGPGITPLRAQEQPVPATIADKNWAASIQQARTVSSPDAGHNLP